MYLKFFHIGNRSKNPSETNVCAHISEKQLYVFIIFVLKELKTDLLMMGEVGP